MKNYYEVLEVSQNASKEVIEKAYKVLAKKNHPDLQEQSQKQNAELKMKLINEAYEVLSNDEKRKEYDIELKRESERIKQIEYQKIHENNIQNSKKEKEYSKQNYKYEEKNYEPQEELKEQITQEQMVKRRYQEEQERIAQIRYQEERERMAQIKYQEEQERMYRNYMRSLGYKIKERWTLKKTIKLLEVIAILIIILLIIWFFPPTHKLLIETYEENEIIKVIVDIIINIIKGIGNGIDTFFKNVFNKK